MPFYVRYLACALPFIALQSTTHAQAQQSSPQQNTPSSDAQQIAVIQCDTAHGRALVRFGLSKSFWTDNAIITDGLYAKIPPALEQAWTGIPHQLRGQCKLKDGQTLSLSYDGVPTGRGGDWGEGTMNVSLSINGHLAYNMLPVQHSNLGSATPSDPYRINAILYDGRTLQEYDPVTPEGSISQDVSKRLKPDYVYTNAIEQAFAKKQKAQQALSKNLSSFCKSFDFANTYEKQGKSWKLLSPDLDKQPGLQINDFLSVTQVSFDINNSGKLSPVFDIHYAADDNPANNVLVAFTKIPSLAATFQNGIKYNILVSYLEIVIPSSLKAASVQIGHQMTTDDYTKPTAYDTASMNVPFRYNGITCIYSYTDGIFVEPESQIFEMKPDNSIATICQFP